MKDGRAKDLVQVYEKVKAQVVVDLEPQVAMAIFAIANEESQ